MKAQALKRTPLYPLYAQHGAKVIDFGGWELPVQFSSIIEEHHTVRTKAGLFDVSHMGEVMIEGPDASAFVQSLITNDVTTLQTNQALYAAMCYPDGGTVDDLLVYKQGEQKFLLVINASNIDKDVDWIVSHAKGEVTVENVSDATAQLAIQGPLAEQVLQRLTATDLSQIRYFWFQQDVDVAGIKALVSRTGYTGEDGFELYVSAADAPSLWEKILAEGKADGVLPCGLGARDTLRFEARLPLYGQELGADITPLEAGIGFAVKLQKEQDFIGKEALQKQKAAGVPRKLVGVELIGRGIPRPGYPVFAQEAGEQDEPIGYITSGTQSPTLKKNLGLALIRAEYAAVDTPLAVEIRGKRVEAVTVKSPFYKR
ncbi:glycine cleavage system aminomethyltransferase GcvT [Brevibacillus parabrevis]|uniref:glycine cleavage system aminomethyltransferase GcvT n=1 Tax=Brevibacillus parabrevis TaxID=54914 RepID=UPI0028533362|nr:glycine cleavage system aminomethyltransferase GcvT [Brevibacillus parabrevis]MDR5000539.1 glycine cleavage system aminomethyltransferase GcvT [Brevibacillus parabrevis]